METRERSRNRRMVKPNLQRPNKKGSVWTTQGKVLPDKSQGMFCPENPRKDAV